MLNLEGFMSSFKIVTDSTCDLPKDYYKEHDLGIMYLSCLMEGETYGKDKELDIKEFYTKVRGGCVPTTSQVNPEEAKEVLTELIKDHKEILYVAFSSGLSGTYQSVNLAATELMEEHSDITIEVVDSLCASLGEGLFVHKAVQMRDSGETIKDTADFLREHATNLCHMFTVDDLNHLYRGGRVSKTTALLGTMIGIKPLMHVDNVGHLVAIGKVRGRKKSLISLVDMMEERIGTYRDKNDIIFISHGDCEEEAQFVADEVKKRFGYDHFIINHVGPVIGTHSGPGTIALFFWGDKR